MKIGSSLTNKLLVCLCAVLLGGFSARAQQRGTFAGRPSFRREKALEAHRRFVEKKEEALQWAATRGLATRVDDGVSLIELMAIEAGRPLYYTTQNANAAISTAADQVRNTAPYNLNGADLQVGVWDAGAILTNHQEFGSRVTVQDGTVSTHYHATHVGGTIGASGVLPNAQGMAPSTSIGSFDWNSDLSEMTAAAASYAGEPDKIVLSNHSYGFIAGWWWDGGNYYWYGTDWSSGATEDFFGQYSSYARDWDEVVYNAPYYLPFKSAGNERTDNPSNGQTVFYLDGSSWVSAVYDSALHPKGDGVYKSGYDTIGTKGSAKNIMTVGAVNDAVSGSMRSVGNGTMSSFSSWGPADDGRIKPDIVANGITLYSTYDTSTASYSYLSGTSMASPNACGSAALLAEYYKELFPGEAMRASTLKGLIIHSADDAGNPGPDYAFGWGLMNTKAAADLLKEYAAGNNNRLTEAQLTTVNTSDTYVVTVTGLEPLRATLCWTDPPGATQTANDSRTSVLVNDLDLKISGPGGTFYPYKLDYNNPSASATTNSENDVDNVEQVYIEFPSAGDYTITVDYDGTLTDGEQWYSLLVSPDSGGIVPPSFFTASAVSTSQVDLTWLKNVSNDNVVVAFNTTGFFINPTNGTTCGVGSSIGPATVIYSGGDTNYQHTNLNPLTRYFYRAWSVNSTSEYSSGAGADIFTLAPPATIPFYEPFATTTFDNWSWALVEDASIDTVGLGEPSEPYSAHLNGNPDGEDVIQTVPFNLSGETTVELSYWYEQTGGGESADAGDDLIVEYLDAGDSWIELERQLGAEADMNAYAQSAVLLPAAALHEQSRFRFRSSGSAGPYDDWFVDDIRLYATTLRITTSTLPLGLVSLAYAATLEADSGTAPYTFCIENGNLQEGLTLDSGGVISGMPTEPGTNQITFTVQDAEGASTNRVLELVVQLQTVDYFTWDIIDDTQILDQPFAVSIAARDVNSNIVSNFSGNVDLNVPQTDDQIGFGSSTWNFPMSTFYHDARTQVIYLQSEIGSSCTITSLALNVATLPGQTMNDWTIRMRHTPLNEYAASAEWESADWVTVYSGNEPAGVPGWREFVFFEPFEYNGSDNLMIDFSHNNTFYTTDGYCECTSMEPSSRSIHYRTDSNWGDPLGWPTNGYNPPRTRSYNIPNIRLGVDILPPTPILPTDAVAFVDGIWTGSVTVLEPSDLIVLQATDADGHSGRSNPFRVLESSHYFNVFVGSTYGISEGHPDSDLMGGNDPLLPNPGDQALVQLIHVGENGIIDAPPGIGGAVVGDDVLLGSYIYEYDGTNYFWDAWAVGWYGTVQVPFVGDGQVYGRIFDSAEVSDGSWYYQGHIQEMSAYHWTTLGTLSPDEYDLGQGVLSFASNQLVTVNLDLDSDTIPDWWEIAYFGSITNCDASADVDNDGMLNWQEYIADTIPTDSNSVLQFIEILPGSNGVDVAWQGGINAWQFLESSGDLAATTEQWMVIFTNFPPTAISNNYYHDMGTNTVLFYRIRADR